MILPWQRRSKSPSDSRFMLSALSLVLVKPKANPTAMVCNVLEYELNLYLIVLLTEEENK